MDKIISRIISSASWRVMKYPRLWYHRIKATHNHNKNVCILCNNCVGGIISHDLGLRFNSPTVNLEFYDQNDFIYLAENIEEIARLKVYEKKKHEHGLTHTFPIGAVCHHDKEILIGFRHYKTFEEAAHKWQSRMKRFDFKRFYLIFEIPQATTSQLQRIARIPCAGRAVLSSVNEDFQKSFPFYHGLKMYETWHAGKILEYKSPFSLKRHVDDLDYISLFNEG